MFIPRQAIFKESTRHVRFDSHFHLQKPSPKPPCCYCCFRQVAGCRSSSGTAAAAIPSRKLSRRELYNNNPSKVRKGVQQVHGGKGLVNARLVRGPLNILFFVVAAAAAVVAVKMEVAVRWE